MNTSNVNTMATKSHYAKEAKRFTEEGIFFNNKQSEMTKEIEALEEKLGIDGHPVHPKFRTNVVCGTTAHNAFQEQTLRPISNGGYETV